MTVIMQNTFKALDAEELRKLARYEGPCVTVQVPDFRPGAPAGSRQVLMRQLTQAATAKLRDLHLPDGAAAVAEALEKTAGEVDLEHGGPGFTLFYAPGLENIYATPGVSQHVAVGPHFHLTSLTPWASVPGEIYALGLNKKHTRLWKVTNLTCEELPLPASVPASLEAAGEFDTPDHLLENRSSSGPSTGSMKAVRFGTSSDRDTAPNYLHNYFVTIHRGLKETLKGAPLFLIGVREETAEYRRAAKDNNLLDTEWSTTPEYVSLDEVAAHAREAARDRYRRAGEALAQAFPETPHNIAGDVAGITKAAREGRVHQLLIAENGAPPEALNTAAVEALRTGAEVYVLPAGTMAGIGAAGAILRY